MNIEYIENPIYDKTNNIYSLSLAQDKMMKDDTLLFESDLIYEEGIVKNLLDNPWPNLALVAKWEYWMDGTVVKIDKDKIYSVSFQKNFLIFIIRTSIIRLSTSTNSARNLPKQVHSFPTSILQGMGQ